MDADEKPGAEGSKPMDASAQNGAGVDIAKLADKVQQLLRDELRLDRARGGGLFFGR
jgi:hypothetical protein